MFLLVEARLADFHCTVEQLAPGDAVAECVAWPLKLETLLAEGSYNKVGGVGVVGEKDGPPAPLTPPPLTSPPPPPPIPRCCKR